MKASMNMTLMLMLFIFTIVFSPIKSFQLFQPFQQVSSVRPADPFGYLVRAVDCFCALSCEGQRHYRSCVIENGYEVNLEFSQNCAQQIQFYPTTQEVYAFICNSLRSCPQEYSQYINCLASAQYAYSLDKPYFYRTLDVCLANADRC
ncbi:uncharacterized protein LOC111628748 [Centruroides sculpturatus]|uniref:uncharacterized protein LOC111628748 n=1 Tax=Centruroides sculpturatus TaxID=218467 RepID=UPI000C6D0158|nr:uncharacterized protein LOC111628748 [Centruroides sculpturatus]XP_023228358.1 uncharacterized protein LOC111628748 [Centruroides sculpturatus]